MTIKVAIIGTGNIGTDLCSRLIVNKKFEITAFIGRRPDSDGIKLFRDHISGVYTNGLSDLIKCVGEVDCVFDATSAIDHLRHWEEVLKDSQKLVIDLTPSKVGRPMVPILSSKLENFNFSYNDMKNFSMVTCGGQSAALLVYAISRNAKEISNIEVSSSIASKSAGPATRRNIDEYISATENLVGMISGCSSVKALLVLNPAEPPVMMRTTVQVSARMFELDTIKKEVKDLTQELQSYVPGYEIVVAPHESQIGVVSATIKVTGAGFYLPKYAGNLDIINSAAVETANRYFNRIQDE